MRRASSAGLAWPLPEDLDDEALEARLYVSSGVPKRSRPEPDRQKIHVELRHPHVTLMLLWHEYNDPPRSRQREYAVLRPVMPQQRQAGLG